jgi:hypothetical protein
MKSKNIIFLGILFIFANSTLTNATRENLYSIWLLNGSFSTEV